MKTFFTALALIAAILLGTAEVKADFFTTTIHDGLIIDEVVFKDFLPCRIERLRIMHMMAMVDVDVRVLCTQEQIEVTQ